MLVRTLILCAVFQLKHLLGDFLLQFPYMMRKKEEGWGFAIPLMSHCLIHAFLSLLIILFIRPSLWWIALVDFGVHFIIDRLKSGPRYLGRFKDMSHSHFWWALGFDQMCHHLTHLVIIYFLLK